jgi:drug/metabolite transporter (DMT)-like permease
MSTTAPSTVRPAPQSAVAWANGFAGIAIFAGSLPATKVAVAAFDPVFLTLARAAIAGLVAVLLLAVLRPARPARADLASLVIVSLGVVVGFPLLTALALKHVTSAHAIVFIGLTPVATALFGAIRGGERPRPAFWAFSVLGSAIVAAYALRGGAEASLIGDGLMLLAILVVGLGYAEGGRLSRRLGGWQVICWALLLSLPAMLPAALLTRPDTFDGVGLPGWLALGYVGLFSMLIGFVFWYRGLALGGIAAVGQLQLLQPFLGFALAALVLGEAVGWPLLAATGAVVLCVAGARRYAH